MTDRVTPLKDWLNSLDVLEPSSAGNLQVFGLRRPAAGDLSYLTLDEALESEAIEITEVGGEGGEGSVPTLKVANKSDSMVFLMAGEELVGAKQNRVLGVSLMVGGKSEIPVPVSCVESGRWRYTSPKFSSAGSASHSKLRRKMARHAEESYRAHGRPSSNQGEVWQEVEDKLACMGSSSPTEALQKVYEDHKKRLDELSERIPLPEECCGVVFSCRDRVLGVDVFDKPETLRKLWPKVIRSYAVDALEERQDTPTVSRERVREWLAKAREAKTATYESPGVGEDVRFQSDDIVGGSLLVEKEPVHVGIFANLN